MDCDFCFDYNNIRTEPSSEDKYWQKRVGNSGIDMHSKSCNEINYAEKMNGPLREQKSSNEFSRFLFIVRRPAVNINSRRVCVAFGADGKNNMPNNMFSVRGGTAMNEWTQFVLFHSRSLFYRVTAENI